MAQNNERQNRNIAQAVWDAIQRGCESSIQAAPFNSCLRGTVFAINSQATQYTIKVGQTMYSSIPEFNPGSELCDSTAFTTCLRPVFYCLGRKKTHKNKKKARCKVDLLC